MRYPATLLTAIATMSAAPPLWAQVAVAPCELLTDAEVTAVVPKHMSGDVDHAGPSLVDGINAYQCSWLDEQAHMLVLVVNSAKDDATFDKIKPDFFGDPDVKKVDLGEGGWLRGDPDDMKVTAVKGHFVLDLELMVPDARQKSDKLIALAQAALSRM